MSKQQVGKEDQSDGTPPVLSNNKNSRKSRMEKKNNDLLSFVCNVAGRDCNFSATVFTVYESRQVEQR